MEETIEQKVIRNVQGNFAIFKTPEVVGKKSIIPNIEWEDSEDIDKFFMFAKNLGAKVIYLTEGEEEDETTGQIKNSILQIGFLHDSIMHHINFIEYDDEDENEEEYEDEDIEEENEVPTPIQKNLPGNSRNTTGDQFIGGEINQTQYQVPSPQPQDQFGGQHQQKVPQQQQNNQQYNQQQNNF